MNSISWSKWIVPSIFTVALTACGGGSSGSSNNAPNAQGQNITVNEDSANNAIVLSGSDADNDALTYALVSQPQNGTLSGTAPNLTYTPTEDYFGNDSFTFRVNDGTVDSAAATVNITVTDVEEADVTAPVVTLNGAATVEVYQNETYTELNAVATDDRDGDISASIVVSGAVDTSVLGPKTLTYTAIDSAGNVSESVTRTVNIVLPPDTEKPTVTLNGDADVTIIQGSVYSDAGVTATDLRDGELGVDSITVTGTVDPSVVGPVTLTYTATDSAGNVSDSITRTVNVVLPPDTEKPTITLNGDANVSIVQGEVYTEEGVTATDVRDGELSGDSITITGTVDTSVVGPVTLTYTATDSAGNVSESITRTVNVVLPPDTEKPTITLNGDANVSIVQGEVYTEEGVTATDVRDGELSGDSITITGTVDTSVVDPVTLTYTATDSAGNVSDSVTRTVNVVLPPDTVDPVITLVGEPTIDVNQSAVYVEEGATAIDDRDGNITEDIETTGTPVDTNVIGEHIVTYSVKDAAGNEANTTRTVNVLDITPPVLTLLGDENMSVYQGQEYVDPKATAIDDHDGDRTTYISFNDDIVDTNATGVYEVTYSVKDVAGNERNAIRTVNVIGDTVRPVITLKGDDNVTAFLNVPYVDLGATAEDNSDGDITEDINTMDNIDINTTGEYTVTYSVTDSSGNEANVTRTVNVAGDTVAPVVTLNGSSTVSIKQGGTYSEQNATAMDQPDGDVTDSIVITGTVDTSTVGEYILTYTATDSSGNEGSATRTVNVVTDTLKQTGQVLSYDTVGNLVTDDSLKDDGYYQKGVSPVYTRANDIVTDSITGLMWQDDTASGNTNKPWLSAANYTTCDDNKSDPACMDTVGDTAATYCSELTLGGYNDWRLPTIEELESIIDYTAIRPSMSSTFENRGQSKLYWSSTTLHSNETYAWPVSYSFGEVMYGRLKSDELSVGCVRN